MANKTLLEIKQLETLGRLYHQSRMGNNGKIGRVITKPIEVAHAVGGLGNVMTAPYAPPAPDNRTVGQAINVIKGTKGDEKSKRKASLRVAAAIRRPDLFLAKAAEGRLNSTLGSISSAVGGPSEVKILPVMNAMNQLYYQPVKHAVKNGYNKTIQTISRWKDNLAQQFMPEPQLNPAYIAA